MRQHEAVPRHPVQRYFALPAVARQYTTSGGAAPFARRGFMCGSLRRDPSLLSASLHSDPGSRTALQSTARATSLSHDPVSSFVCASIVLHPSLDPLILASAVCRSSLRSSKAYLRVPRSGYGGCPGPPTRRTGAALQSTANPAVDRSVTFIAVPSCGLVPLPTGC